MNALYVHTFTRQEASCESSKIFLMKMSCLQRMQQCNLLYVCLCVCMYMCVSMCVCTCVCMYMYVRECACMHACNYVCPVQFIKYLTVSTLTVLKARAKLPTLIPCKLSAYNYGIKLS